MYTFDVAAFRISYPAFSNPTTFPDALLQMNFTNGTSYIQNKNAGWLNGVNRYQALTLMTAHLTQIGVIIANNQVPNLINGATIDKVSVTLTPPPVPNQWQWWLNTTAYGQQLLALLQVNSVGGVYVGGTLDRLSFRQIGGRCFF